MLTTDAIEIWQAGVRSVDSCCLVRRSLHCDRETLRVAGVEWTATSRSRICVVGAGKAGAGMAKGVEQALSLELLSRTGGWVNVPEDCVQQLTKIHLHGARPAGINEPTEAGVFGTHQMLSQIRSLREDDLCLVLISGGGSALLPAPPPGIPLDDKLQLTRTLSRAGATISELNLVRRNLSEIKGGGLLRRCSAGLVITLLISDVIGDPLETIASGPTVLLERNPELAIEVLRKYESQGATFPASIWRYLGDSGRQPISQESGIPEFVNLVIGNNQTAVQAAAEEARRRDYRVVGEDFDQPGEAAPSGRDFARHLDAARRACPGEKICLISGGETTVRLAQTDGPQRGGRNQEFALAALDEWLAGVPCDVALVSGGTDGEDGPTDAAGAVVDTALLRRVRQMGVKPLDYLAVNNSYSFFERLGGLLRTGPTHTNVMDLRVGLACDPGSSPE